VCRYRSPLLDSDRASTGAPIGSPDVRSHRSAERETVTNKQPAILSTPKTPRASKTSSCANPDITQERFFTVADVARRVGVRDKTIRRWIDDELLSVHQPRGRGGGIRIAESDLISFLAQSRRNRPPNNENNKIS